MIRTGFGIDVHQFAEGRKLILGGIEIPHEQGLLGHSDADVLSHAITDALLGAAGLGDIGQHFPDTDPQFKDADSIGLLKAAVQLLEQHGFNVEHVDCTVMAEEPKLHPHREEIRSSLSAAIGVGIPNVNVKATTAEKMGFLGRGEGIAAFAVATVSVQASGNGAL